MRKFYFIFVTVILCYSCITTSPSSISPSEYKDIPLFSISPDIELLGLRSPITIPKSTTTTINSNHSASNYTSFATKHPLCINLGNGIYIDYYGTVFISVEEVLKLKELDNYSISGQNGASDLSKFIVNKKNKNRYTVDHNNSYYSLEVNLREGEVYALSNGSEIKVNSLENGYFVTIDGNGLLGPSDNQHRITQYENNSIEMNNHMFSINESGDTLTITPIDNESSDSLFDLFKSKEVSFFYSKITIRNNVIKFYKTYDTGRTELNKKMILTDDGYIIYSRGSSGSKERLIKINENSVKTKIGLRKYNFEINLD